MTHSPSTGGDEDFATVPVPDAGRTHWSKPLYALSGIATALFYMQVGSIITQQYGADVALAAIAYATVMSAFVGAGMAALAIRSGFGTNLLARHLLGIRGAAVFSVMMGITGLTYFIAEANIMGAAIHAAVPVLPIALIQGAIGLMMIPALSFGITFLARLQAATLVIYAVFLAAALVLLAGLPEPPTAYSLGSTRHPFGTGLVQAIGILNGVVFVTALIVADFARFVDRRYSRPGTLALGVLFPATCFAVAGSLGMYFTMRLGEPNPGTYFVQLLGIWGTLFAIGTQIRINLANMYIGSLAFSNAAFQITGITLRQRSVLIGFVALATALLLSNMVEHLTATLTWIGMFTANFTVLVLIDGFGIGDRRSARRLSTTGQAQWSATGLTCLLGSTVFGAVLLAGFAGEQLQALAVVVAALTAGLSYWLVKLRTSPNEDR